MTARDRHGVDLFYTQNGPAAPPSEGDVMFLVNFKEYFRGNQSCNQGRFKSQTITVAISKVLTTGSSLFIERINNARYQERTRSQVEEVLDIPPGVRYFIDLTPSAEGDEQALALTNLTLTKGVIQWAAAPSSALAISEDVVGGHDDSCHCFMPHRTRHEATGRTTLSLWDASVPEILDIIDYDLVRHAANAVRLIHRIQGQPIVLDSFARVWTLVGLMRLYGLENCEALVSESKPFASPAENAVTVGET